MNINNERLICFTILFTIPALIYGAHKDQKKNDGGNLPVRFRSAYSQIPLANFDYSPCMGVYEFKNIDFGKGNDINGFIAKARATYIPAGWIEIRLDSQQGQKIGMCLISKRDGDNDWYIAKTGIYDVEGLHSVFLLFPGAEYAGFNPQIEWFSFTSDDCKVSLLADKTILPEQVPYLGPLEKNFLGNGVAGAGGDTNGRWDYLVGPAYTSKSYIDEETVSISIEGHNYLFFTELKRARGTGIFYSKMRIDDVTFFLVDFALQNCPFVTRAVFVENTSSRQLKFSLTANIKPSSYLTAGSDGTLNDSSGLVERKGLHLCLNDKNSMSIAFSDSFSFTLMSDTGYIVRTRDIILQPGENYRTGLYHYAHRERDEHNEIISMISSRDVAKDLESCILNWKAWLAEGFSLDSVGNLRIRDIIEANSIIIKMLQGADGGIMATPRIYQTSFIRDSHNALRGMVAMGHTSEARDFLLWVNSKYKILREKGQFPIPNAGDIGGDGTFAGFGNEDNWSAETPALYLMIAEGYFRQTNDLTTLQTIDESLRFAMNCQLDCAEKNKWKLPFNGDETESGGSGINLWDKPGKWSMPSLLLCCASLQFFIHYLELTGDAGKIKMYREKLLLAGKSLNSNFWNENRGIYDWYIDEKGERSVLPVSNYLLMPVYFNYPADTRQFAVKCVESMKAFITGRGFIPVQPGSLNGDFCGHSMGYLLYALSELNDPLKDCIFDSLIWGGTVGCWGTWSESYTGDGLSYGPEGGTQYWEKNESPIHNLRPFESGTNLDAIVKYLNIGQKK